MSENIIIALIGALSTIVSALITTLIPLKNGKAQAETSTKSTISWKKIIIIILISVVIATPTIAFVSPKIINTTPIKGDWSGRMEDDETHTTTRTVLYIKSFCYRDSICGTVYIPAKSYRADLRLVNMSNDVYRFEEVNVQGLGSGGYNYIHVQNDGTLFRLFTSYDGLVSLRGTLERQQ